MIGEQRTVNKERQLGNLVTIKLMEIPHIRSGFRFDQLGNVETWKLGNVVTWKLIFGN